MDLIVGSGITGLSYANFCNHANYLVIEQDSKIGGYCKTIKRNGFIWDYSGHFFHFRNKEIENYLIKKIGKDNISRVKKNTQILYKDKFIDFPFQKNIHQLNKIEFIDCLYDLFNNPFSSYTNFKEMLFAKFGKSISEKFLIPYNEKLYACNLDSLDFDAMGRFFPYAEKEDIIKNFKNPDNVSYNSYFTYPHKGAIEYVNSLYSRLDKAKIKLDTKLLKIDYKNKIALTNKGNIKYNRIISTIPFPNLLKILNLDFDNNIYNWNKVLVFNLGFNKKGFDKKNHWIYFPEKKYSFYRIGYYDNILDQDRMSLYVELGFAKDEKIDANKFLKIVLEDLKKAKIIDDTFSLVDYEPLVMNPAYVHINSLSIKDVNKKKNFISEFDIYSIGRYGSWTYCSIEDNIIEAKKLTKKINNQ
tara:strand:- start:164 stop:1408 length:1245 start_codon:yes stop_codon:yes gene_type:complete